MPSQGSFGNRAERFVTAAKLIATWADYTPGNALIQKVPLATFAASLSTANVNVNSLEVALDLQRGIRTPLVFEEKKLANPLCFVTRLRGIHNYLKGEGEVFSGANASVKKMLRKLRPQYKKKKEGEPPARSTSPSEKSFASALSFLRETISIVSALGAAYTPPDANLSVAALTALKVALETATDAIQQAESDLAGGRKARRKLFTGPDGRNDREKLIRSYLASFPGLKNSNHYIAFDDAMKRS